MVYVIGEQVVWVSFAFIKNAFSLMRSDILEVVTLQDGQFFLLKLIPQCIIPFAGST